MCYACRPAEPPPPPFYCFHLLVYETRMFHILHFLQPRVSDFVEPVIPPAWFNWGILAGIFGAITEHCQLLPSMLRFLQNLPVDVEDTTARHASAGVETFISKSDK